jgi:predicted extracellular nuclease
VLANAGARALVTGADIWQINAQEAVAYAYSRYNYNATILFDGTDPFAASDHDPVVAGLRLQGPGKPRA